MDYAEHDLYEILRYHRGKAHTALHPATVKSIMWQLLNGLSYLEQNWIIHRDLKPSNILVMGDGEEQVMTDARGIWLKVNVSIFISTME